MRSTLLSLALVGASVAVLAKLPPPDEAAKAKAAETSARNAWQARVDAFQLCKAQDRVAGAYRKTAAARPGAGTAPAVAPAAAAAPAAGTPVLPAPAVTTAPAASAPAAAVAAAATPPAAAAPGATAPVPVAMASAPSVATPPIPPCIDPGPFAYTPPEQKPLETSGAHSPAATAASPPSVRAPAAEMTPTPKK